MSKTIGCRIEEPIDNLLEKIAKQKNATKSDIVKESLGYYLQEMQNKLEPENLENSIANSENDNNNPSDNNEDSKNLTKDLTQLALLGGTIWLFCNKIKK